MATVLITGGTGYLGQFITNNLAEEYKVAFTYHSSQDFTFCPKATGHKVDLISGEGLASCISALGDLQAVINCAAISQPGVCEKEPQLARSVNVPTKLVEALKRHATESKQLPLLIHISTDQVYDGSKPFWKESDATEPVNEYGRSKVEAEHYLQEHYPNHVILRSSIIYGPPPPRPVPRALFLQFVDGAFAKDEPTTFFEDEYRNPIFVMDIVCIVTKLIQMPLGDLQHRVFNMGGPERLSRVDMAQKVAECRGHNQSKILAVPAASVARGVQSPPDISMDVERLQGVGIQLTSFSDALREIFQ